MAKMFSLTKADWIKSLILAVIVAVLKVLLDILNLKGLNLTWADWQSVLNVALTALVAYIGKNFFTDQNGKFLGKI